MSQISLLSIFVVLFVFLMPLSGQPPAPVHLLHAPVGHPIRLSGTFGELRSNHFHGGLDIKSSNGAWGDPIFAVDSGYISRIVVSASGFGRALYLTHPTTGLTSVYGHLQGFITPVEAYVYQNQKAQESFSVDLNLRPDQFPVRKGEKIATMGSTGFSFGPHLHFELRRTNTGDILNPALYNFDLNDQQKPVLKGITIYRLDHQLIEYAREELNLAKDQPDTITVDAWRIGIGVETFDPHNGGRNKNGIYTVRVELDQEKIYEFALDSLSVEDAHYYKTHIDYGASASEGRKIHRCFRIPADRLSIYRVGAHDGIIPLFKNRLQKITISISDLNGNTTTKSFYIERTEQVTPADRPVYQYHLVAGEPDTIRSSYMELIWPENALYQDCYLQFGAEPVLKPGVFSATYRIDRDRTPLRKALTLNIRPFPAPDSMIRKLTIVELLPDNKRICCPSTWSGAWLSCTIGRLGSYQIIADTVPPSIQFIRKSSDGDGQRIEFIIKDDLVSPGGLKYRASLNDQWTLAEYDLKQDRLTCHLRTNESIKGTNIFKLLVEDRVGNVSQYDYRFHLN